MTEARREALVKVVHRGRRFFAPGAAAEIWAELRPLLDDDQKPECFEVCGGLSWVCLGEVPLLRYGPSCAPAGR